RGTLDIGWRQSRLRVTGQKPRVLPAAHYDRQVSHAAMMNAFVEVVRGARPPWITPVECLRAVAAVEASHPPPRPGRLGAIQPIEDSNVGAPETPQRLRAQA